MEIKFCYSIITNEGLCVPNVTEKLPANTPEEKELANARYIFLKTCGFAANVEYQKIDVPSRRVIQAVYSPNGKVYTFEVNFSVRIHEAVEVEDLDNPGYTKFVVAVSQDYEETEEEISKRFPIQRLRKARRYK